MLCPHGADFFVRRKLPAICFSQRSIDVGGFFGRQLVRRLLDARKLEKHPRKIVLHVVGEDGDRCNGLFKQSGHAVKYRGFSISQEASPPTQKTSSSRQALYGLPITIAIAAARNGNGTDTAARNQTNRAGMNGISHSKSR